MLWRSLACIAAMLVVACSSDPPRRDEITPEYRVVADWPQLPPGFAFGQVVGVGVDSHDRVYVFHRAGATFNNDSVIEEPTVAVFDAASGELLDHWGDGLFIVPHGLAVAPDDHVWVTDVGADAVFEMSPEGEVLRRLDGDAR